MSRAAAPIAGVLILAFLLAGCASTADAPPSPRREATPPMQQKVDLSEAARLNTELGVAYARQGQFDVALEKLERALEQNPNHAPAHSAIALVYVQRRDPVKAEDHYRRALRLSPRDPYTRNNFAIFLCGQNRFADAETLFVEAAQEPNYADAAAAFTNAGVCMRRVPDLDKAEQHFRQALGINEQFSEALAQLASLYYERKDYLRARAFVQRYERAAPPTAAILWIGAKVEFALGDELAAAQYARRLQSEFPGSDEQLDIAPRPAS